MAITTAVCRSLIVEAFTKQHNFTVTTGDAFKLALIKATPAGTYNTNTTNLSDVTGNSDETSGTGYTAGGIALVQETPVIDSGVIVFDFGNVSWASSTISADGCIIYNSTLSNAAVAVYDFGATKSTSDGTFTITMPGATSTTAILRFA